jgi:hypothetical protein
VSDQVPPPPPPGGGYSAPPPPPGGEGQPLPARGLGDILSAAFEIYYRNATRLLTIVAIVVVPLAVLSWLIVRVALGPAEATVDIGGQTVKIISPRGFFVVVLAALVAAAIGVIITSILQAAMLRGAAQATIGDPVDVQASYRWGLRRFGSVLLVSFLVGLAVVVGLIFLIIPGIILAVMFSVSVPAVVVENLRGTEAMTRSWNLVKGHFWHVLVVVLVAAIIAGVVSSVLNAIGSSNDVLALIFGIIAQVITAPFTALVSVLLYLDRRARTESLTAATLRAEMGSGL